MTGARRGHVDRSHPVSLAAEMHYRLRTVAGRRRATSFEGRICEETSRRYLPCGISHWEFVRAKLAYDPMFRAILRSPALPSAGRLVDVGCGRGIVLALLDTARELGASPQTLPGWRPSAEGLELVGIELDGKKAAVAARTLGTAARVTVGGAAVVELPRARAFLLLDVLHYLPPAHQELLVERVARALEPGGVVILREADAGMGWRFILTRAAERLAALARGHWRQKFHYRTAAAWRGLLEANGLVVSERPMWAGTPYGNRWVEARPGAGVETPMPEVA